MNANASEINLNKHMNIDPSVLESMPPLPNNADVIDCMENEIIPEEHPVPVPHEKHDMLSHTHTHTHTHQHHHTHANTISPNDDGSVPREIHVHINHEQNGSGTGTTVQEDLDVDAMDDSLPPSLDLKWNENFAFFQDYVTSTVTSNPTGTETEIEAETKSEEGDPNYNDTNSNSSANGNGNGIKASFQSAYIISLENLEANNRTIFKWVQQQRSYASKWEAGLPSPMTSDKMQKLNSVNFFEMFFTKWEEAWSRHYEDYRQHVLNYTESKSTSNPSNSNNNSNSPSPDVAEKALSYELKGWVRRQRNEYAKFERAEKTSLTRQRIEKLDAINFQWDNAHNDITDPKFLDKLQDLKAFKKQNGHLEVPKIYPANKPLGRWVARQRAQYRRKGDTITESCGMLTAARIKVLDDLGFPWASTSKFTPGVTWEKRFGELVEYKARYGHFNVPKKFAENKLLATWVRNQRCFYMAKKRRKKSPMTAERIEKLEKIGFEWKLRG